MAQQNQANLEPAQALGLDLTVAPPRWTSLQRKLTFLSRNGVTNFVAAIAGAPLTAGAVASLTEASLRATYEGPLSTTYTGATQQQRVAWDAIVNRILGGSSFVNPFWGLSDSACGVRAAQLDADDPSVFRP